MMGHLRVLTMLATAFSIACGNYESTPDGNVWTLLRKGANQGIAIVLQPGECFSRRADIAVVLGQLQIQNVVVLLTGDTSDVSLRALLARIGNSKPLYVSRSEGVRLRRAGLTTTPGIIVWKEDVHEQSVVSMSTNRLQLYEQIRTIDSRLPSIQ